MKRRVLWISCIFVLMISILMGIYFFLHHSKNSHELVLYGNVDVRQVDIAFRVPGQVDAMCFEEGDLVPKDALLASLVKSPYDSQLSQAFANLEAVKVTKENAEILLNRRQELIEIYGVSQEDLDNAQSNYKQLKANYLQAEAQLNIARDNLSFTEAFAPNEGIILTRIREPGTVVKESDPVYTLSLTSPVWIRAFVSEPDLGKVYYGMSAEIITDTKGAPTYLGKVGFISPVAEFTPKTVETTQLRTDLVYRLRIYVDQPGMQLKQGMPVTVKLKNIKDGIQSE